MLLCKSYSKIRKKREKYEGFLKSVKILKTIEPYELTKILDVITPVEFMKDTKIINEVSLLNYRVTKEIPFIFWSQVRHMR